MKRLLIALAAVCAAPLAIPSAVQAQPWLSINERQANLDRRIDQGVRSGALTGNEASRLRREFNELSQLETQYRRSNGLSDFERRDLDRRFDGLSARIRDQARDDDRRGNGGYGDGRGDGRDAGAWRSINDRQDELDRRIDEGVRRGGLTGSEAARLRTEFREIARIEAQYRRSGRGLDDFERRDLDRRFDLLSQRIRYERQDRNRRN